jgi:hypothetical protein
MKTENEFVEVGKGRAQLETMNEEIIEPEESEQKLTYRKPFHREPINKVPRLENITERDIEILYEIYENRFLTFSLLLSLFPPMQKQGILSSVLLPDDESSPKRPGTNLYKRLQRLHLHHYLKRLPLYDLPYRLRPVEQHQHHVYALDTRGADLLRKYGHDIKPSIDWKEKNREQRETQKHHTIMTARIYVAFKTALRDHPYYKLKRIQRNDIKVKWKLTPNDTNPIIIDPDLLVLITDTRKGGYFAWLIEADRSTMSLDRMLEKFTRHSFMLSHQRQREFYQLENVRILTVTKSRERARNLHELLKRNDIKRLKTSKLPKNYVFPQDHLKFFYFATEEDYLHEPKNIFSTIWHPGHQAWMQPNGIRNTRGITDEPLPFVAASNGK